MTPGTDGVMWQNGEIHNWRGQKSGDRISREIMEVNLVGPLETIVALSMNLVKKRRKRSPYHYVVSFCSKWTFFFQLVQSKIGRIPYQILENLYEY